MVNVLLGAGIFLEILYNAAVNTTGRGPKNSPDSSGYTILGWAF